MTRRHDDGRTDARAYARTVAAAIGVASLVWASLAAAEIHRCPRPDGTTEYRDRPCGAGPAEAVPGSTPGTTAPARRSSGAAPGTRDAERAAPAPTFVSPAIPTSGANPVAADAAPAVPPGPPPATRAAYVARNESRCREGDRRACAAVTCDRSGDLGSPACQEAVGYVRGRGWDLRPASDAFDAGRARDDYLLTCRSTGRRAALSRARGSDIFDWPGGPSPTVARTALAAAATAFCTAR